MNDIHARLLAAFTCNAGDREDSRSGASVRAGVIGPDTLRKPEVAPAISARTTAQIGERLLRKVEVRAAMAEPMPGAWQVHK